VTIRIRIRPHRLWTGSNDDEFFWEDIVPGIGTLVSSFAGHILVILLIGIVANHVKAWLDDDVDWSRYRTETLRLHLSEPLIYRATAPDKLPVSSSTHQANSKPARGNRAGAAPSASPRTPQRLELPAPSQVSKNTAVLLQPDFQPQTMPAPVLPPLAFWARQVAAPKPAPKQFVVPGRIEEHAAVPLLDAPPVLAIPNREERVAAINISQVTAPKPSPIAPANSATIPIRVRSENEVRTASFETSIGQATNVLSLAAERLDIKDVQIPRGLQSIPKSADGGGQSQGGLGTSTAGSGSAAGNASTAGTASNGSAKGKETAKAESGTAGNDGKSASKAGSGPAAENAAGKNTAGSPKGSAPAINATPVTEAKALPRPANPETTRIQHPSNGNFDVVVMQSRSRDDLPDVGGLLTGSPVYTVYLPVGDHREWLLEYCVQGGESKQASPYQINIDDATPVNPPYPVSTTIPNKILGQAITRQIVLHGFLTAGGSLQNVKAVDANNPMAIQILSLLSEWQFRPALRNNKPIDIEIILVVPARS